MTYLSAKDWCENNVSQSMFDDFDDWLEACKNEFDNGFELFSNSEFISLMRDSWDAFSGEREEEIEERKEIEEEIEKRIAEEPKIEEEKVFTPTDKGIFQRLREKLPREKIPAGDIVFTESKSTAQIDIPIKEPPQVLSGQAPVITEQRFSFEKIRTPRISITPRIREGISTIRVKLSDIARFVRR